jgi:Phage integrase, N-terminal SAM-like domain
MGQASNAMLEGVLHLVRERASARMECGVEMAKGTIERKCLKGHNKADESCSASCLRWYPRIEHPTPDGDGRRRFDYLGGYPTKAAAQQALDQACRRRHDDPAADRSSSRRRRRAVASGPATAHPTVNQLLDQWLAHLQTKGAIRLRTLGRYHQLLHHHLRPYLGTLPLSALSTLRIQRLYDHLPTRAARTARPAGCTLELSVSCTTACTRPSPTPDDGTTCPPTRPTTPSRPPCPADPSAR